MKRNPFHTIIACLSLTLMFLTGPAGAQAYVWCLGEDGHAALERAADKACAAGADIQDRACHGEGALELSLQKKGCGPCYDLAATFDAASRRIQDHFKSFSPQGNVPAVALVFSSPARVRVLTANLFPQPPPRVDQTLLAHRTVVLLN